MTIRDKLLNHLKANPNDYWLGSSVLARKLDCSAQGISLAFNHPDLANWKAKRGNYTPSEWDKDRPYTNADFWTFKQEQKDHKRKAYLTRFTTLSFQADYGQVIVFAQDAKQVLDHLQNGLSTLHKSTLKHLGKFERVASQYHDGCIIVSDRSGNHIASDHAAHISSYRKFIKLGEQQYE